MNSLASSVSSPAHSVESVAFESPWLNSILGRLSAYKELAKPRIALLVVFAVAVGTLLASEGNWHPWTMVHASIGVLLAVIASSSFNQLYERRTDSLMPRTQNRPLPSARLYPLEVFCLALFCTICSFAYLMVLVNALTAWLTLLTTVLYAGCYTPLKRYTSLCTVVGAIPGALPPVLGWTAVRGDLDWGAFALFAIMFVWQFPHFLAIAWIYRDQYERAGLFMIPGRGRPGIIGGVSAGYALVLIPVSLLPVQLGLAGDLYGLVAVVLGILYAWSSLQFQQEESRQRARMVLWISLLYLPGVLAALTLDHCRLLS